MSDEAQLLMLMLQIAESINIAEHRRTYGLPYLSLEFQVLREIEAAERQKHTLMVHYPSEEQRAVSKRLVDFEDITDLQGPEVDMLSQLQSAFL
ncbi:hypothetical protein PHISCL_03120 [Aspergillus sclerotialis]|uniref:Uncharacterized protein n=1 Tax=Aspergillus sclerotialis TaxID=2070753 RepID=A0A3A2ZQG0_9EURO|nr:hypothetical protein PHISCL_03120 [Aspergillus sclerotialis]